MIIDFHTHVFPDKIAASAVKSVGENTGIKPYSDGTVTGLLSALSEANVDIAVNLPAITKPSQFDGVRLFAEQLNAKDYGMGPKIISFAGMHPDCEDVEEKTEHLKKDGFLGIKIHPDYQGTYIDDEKYVRILNSAKKHGLIVLTHAGLDGAYIDSDIKCTPTRVMRLLDKVGGYEKLVLAHLGGNEMTTEVYNTVAGEDVYLDTSFVLPRVKKSDFDKILSKHGDKKILFATDSPWQNIKDQVSIIRSFKPGAAAEERIFSINARALLGI